MFEYFPSHYSWNLGVMMAVQLGGEMTEIDGACRPLRPVWRRSGWENETQAPAAGV
jgi:hypothetical protein